jgi:HEAT repeat protein
MLRYRPSWMLLANTLDDRHPDIQLVALRSLAALGGLEGFQVLRDRLHAVVQGKASFPPVKSLLAAMSTYDLSCVQALVPSLRHTNRQIRLNTAQVLQVMVYRESVHQRRFDHTMDLLTPPMVELVLSKLAVDISAEIRARAAEILVHLTDPRTFSVLHNLLLDPQWSVRLSTLRALTRTHRASAPLHKEIRDFLRDPHWQVREAAIKILISLGQEEKQEIYNYYLNSPDPGVREQIAMMIQRTGLLPVLVEDYCAGVKGVHALVVEELASHSASVGLPGVLRHLAPGNRQRFMERFRPVAQSRKTLQENMGPAMEGTDGVHQALEYPPHLAA